MTQSLRAIQKEMDTILSERLGYILFVLIGLSLAVYIFSLNAAISESYRKEKILRDSKLSRQELLEKEEVFAAKLANFYEKNTASFVAAEKVEPQFASRSSSVAEARPATVIR